MLKHHGNNTETAETEIAPKFVCKCGKEYLSNSGLWKHTKSCNTKYDDKLHNLLDNMDANDKDKLIIFLIKQNAQLITDETVYTSILKFFKYIKE